MKYWKPQNSVLMYSVVQNLFDKNLDCNMMVPTEIRKSHNCAFGFYDLNSKAHVCDRIIHLKT